MGEPFFESSEELVKYWRCLSGMDRKWSIAEESNARALNMPMLTDESYDALKKALPSTTQIMGTHCYDILANPIYQQMF